MDVLDNTGSSNAWYIGGFKIYSQQPGVFAGVRSGFQLIGPPMRRPKIPAAPGDGSVPGLSKGPIERVDQ
jgi:hypothetical protein